jgi:hypothetical protein
LRKLRVDWFAQRQSQGTAARWAPTERCTLGAFFFAGAHLRVLFCSLLFRHLRPFGNALHMNKHFGVVAALIFAGCSVEAESTLTARLRRVTTETPEFGGVRRTDSRAPVSGGTLTVFVRSAGSVANATGAAAESNMLAAKDLLSVEGASSLDFDETTGYLRVGVSSADALPALENKIQSLSLDPELIIVQVEAPTQLRL